MFLFVVVNVVDKDFLCYGVRWEMVVSDSLILVEVWVVLVCVGVVV